MRSKILKIFRSLRDVEKSCREITEMLEERLRNIPRYKSCVYSKVPEGRVWCDYHNQTMAGRCGSCRPYINKHLMEKENLMVA